MKRVWALVAVLIGASGCSRKLPLVAGAQAVVDREPVMIYGKPLEIRLSGSRGEAAVPYLIVYATGDGGWQGLNQDVFDWLSESGYMVAGFSSRSYLQNLVAVSEFTTPLRLVRDLESVTDVAVRHFGLSGDTSIILVGLSRGADLSAVAAGQAGFRRRLAGLLVIGLTDEEEYLRHHRPHWSVDGTEEAHADSESLDAYASLKGVEDIPVVLIQSTNDGYVPAATARALFGPDTSTRRLVSVNADDHSFRGGCESLYQDLRKWMLWISETSASSAGSASGAAGRLPLRRASSR